MLKLSIIGCGNVAKTMSFLWHKSASVEIVDVVNRTQTSADESVAFIGSGKALCSLDKLRASDIFVIGCGDDHIESCLDELLVQELVGSGTIIFHFSGAKSSKVLEKANTLGAKCASLHPVKSFADPATAITTFKNTYCGLEGDDKACEVLEELIKNIGGLSFKVDSDKKLIYHAASVFACNYMVALQEVSIKALVESGIDRDLAMKILEPIVKETAENTFQMGTVKALTGPIARGDNSLISEQLNAVKKWDSNAADIYRLLGKIAVELSDEKGVSDKKGLDFIRETLKK